MVHKNTQHFLLNIGLFWLCPDHFNSQRRSTLCHHYYFMGLIFAYESSLQIVFIGLSEIIVFNFPSHQHQDLVGKISIIPKGFSTPVQ